jgi:hypothetical protein
MGRFRAPDRAAGTAHRTTSAAMGAYGPAAPPSQDHSAWAAQQAQGRTMGKADRKASQAPSYLYVDDPGNKCLVSVVDHRWGWQQR